MTNQNQTIQKMYEKWKVGVQLPGPTPLLTLIETDNNNNRKGKKDTTASPSTRSLSLLKRSRKKEG